MTFVWSFGTFSFFLVPFYLSTIKANVYHLSLSVEFAEFMSSVVCIFITRLMPLKRALVIFATLVCVGSVCLLLYTNSTLKDKTRDPKDGSLYPIMLLLINFGVVASFDVAYLINTEYFPPVILSTAYGVCNVVGRLVSILSPVAAKAPHPVPLLVLIAFSGIVIGAGSMLKKHKEQ